MNKYSVENHYKNFPECKREDVLKLMEWNKQQPHLPVLDEREVAGFFYACNCSTELTKQTIDICYTAKTHCPEFFGNLDVRNPEFQSAMAIMDICELKKRTPEGYRVVFSRFSDCDPTKYNLAHTLKLYCACYEQLIVEGGMAKGDVIVMDMAGSTLGHVARLGIMTVKKILFYIQEGAPIRLRGYHFLNAPPFTDQILSIIKPFVNSEFFQFLKIHTALDSIYPYVPKDILPSDYGGEGESIRELADECYANLMRNREYFLQDEIIRRVNEKLRPGRPKNASDLFGAEGNFKKLEFD